MSTTPRFGATRVVANQSSAEVPVNDANNRWDVLVALSFINMTTTAPPGSPAEGDAYLVAAGATGDWSGHDGKIAAYYNGWIFIAPKVGLRAYDQDTTTSLVYNGSAWV